MNPHRYFMNSKCSVVENVSNNLWLVRSTRDAGYPPGRWAAQSRMAQL
jgi:hypothetical protein